MTVVLIVAAALVLVVALYLLVLALLSRPHRVGDAVIEALTDNTRTDANGAVRSIQGADVLLPPADLDRLWTPHYLERLARTYWRFLTRVTLGMIRVHYTEGERWVCLVTRHLRLLTFQAPEYEMDAERGIVRWRIDRGLLVARRGRGGDGYLEIDVRRLEPVGDRARMHVEVEVANFYPAIASGFGRWLYENTQSRVHVIVTYGFLRSLARLDLAESRIGRYPEVTEESVSGPSPPGRPSASAASDDRGSP